MITVKHHSGLFTVWNADDAVRLRKEHHIVGNLVGALPEFPRQHNDYGLPLVLKTEEVRLLCQLSLATITDTSPIPDEAHHFASEQCQSFYRQLQVDLYEEINNRTKETRKAEIEANLERIVQGKIKKAKLNLEGPELAAFHDKIRDDLFASIQDLPKDSNGLLTRFYIESPIPRPTERPFQMPPLPPFTLEALKFTVFEHFWRKGYFLTDGIKFGGHYLAYDNDPMVFHAKFIIMCCPDAASLEHFESTLVQAYGRLGKNVRKNVIVAHYDTTDANTSSTDGTAVVYKHLHWNMIGLT